MLMMKKLKNLEFEPVHPKNVLLASVVHGISCLFDSIYMSDIKRLPNALGVLKFRASIGDIQNFQCMRISEFP
jgi:hypothetical protein